MPCICLSLHRHMKILHSLFLNKVHVVMCFKNHDQFNLCFLTIMILPYLILPPPNLITIVLPNRSSWIVDSSGFD